MNAGTEQAQQEAMTADGADIIWSHSEWNENLSEAMGEALQRLEEKVIEQTSEGHYGFTIIARNDTFSQVDDMWTVSLTAKMH